MGLAGLVGNLEDRFGDHGSHRGLRRKGYVRDTADFSRLSWLELQCDSLLLSRSKRANVPLNTAVARSLRWLGGGGLVFGARRNPVEDLDVVSCYSTNILDHQLEICCLVDLNFSR